ncbi:OLC1v1022646C2 [Oldenlandia corymbosa var. corymbosa]|nr:OLC1v1022646C2 [Oldenlandia corymbosa var. corymbosa]
MEEEDRRETLLPNNNNNKNKAFARSQSHAFDELKSFRSWLKWMCVDQSGAWHTFLSWSVFIVLAIIVPCLSHFYLACSDCDSRHSRPYDTIVQLSLTTLATLSFVCLSQFVRKYGLRRFLFFDRLCDESETVRKGYTAQLNRSLKLLFIFVLPCFTVECAYKIWWYASGGTRIPFLGNVIVSDTVACILELCSWLYRTVVFFLVCVLFRLICYLQILRLQDFAQVFQVDSDVESVLREHLRVRRHLRIISHRYRVFIMWALIIITASQFASLLMTTRPAADLNIYKTGELALCSVSLLAGLLIILRSATRITHKAQAVTSLAAKWHVCATIDSFDNTEAETPVTRVVNTQVFPDGSDADDVGDEEDEIDNTELVPSYAYNTISFQKRQALVTYFENNRAGITLYGFMLDRTSLHTIFGIELSLVLWLLGKTIGIS